MKKKIYRWIEKYVNIAVNLDKVVPAEDGVVPGTGLVIGVLYWLRGRKPLIIGKPSPVIVKERF